jgi:hypothetical protein
MTASKRTRDGLRSTTSISTTNERIHSRERSTTARWHSVVFMVAIAHAIMLAATPCQAFTLSMMSSYQAPLKSITDRRRPSRSSLTSKSAYAGALAIPTAASPSLPSFEQRMRQLVVGTSIQPAKPKVNSAPKPVSPPNVMTIKTLSEFKDVVANEKDKVIAVRFHATWCKVS